jgi:cholesterol transport system auxiliary component
MPGILALIALMSWALTGCGSSLLGGEPAQRTYLLDAQFAMEPAEHSGRQTVLVTEPRAEAGFDTPRIAYSQAPAALNYYTQSSWVDTPARMLLPLIVRVLEDSRAFKAVLTPPASVPVDLRLDINLIRLQQEFLQHPSRVRITLRAKLIDEATRHILATQLFEAIEIAPSEDAYGGVQAATRATERLLREIRAFVLEYAPQATLRG